MSTVISFGASITYGARLPSQSSAWSAIIANKLNLSYLCLAKNGCSNSSIAREIISYTDYKPDDLILVMWTSSTRYEFKNENGWQQISTWSEQKGFVKEWYKGPGYFEYTEATTTAKEIILAARFLEEKKLKYLFVFDNNEIKNYHTFLYPDNYIQSLLNMMPSNNMLWFDKNLGFIEWSRQNNYNFIDTHPDSEAHLAAANYILDNFSFNV